MNNFRPSSFTYALVDCNNFYVSCERVFNPRLRNRPVAVLSNNDGCIVARSEEVKKLDLGFGLPVFKFQKLLHKHGVILRSSNYTLYADMSRRVMETLEEFTDHMEIYSIDEAFLRFPPTTPEESNKLGAEIRQRVGQWTGIPVAVGFAPTKTLAKLANHLAKKRFNGVCSLTTTGEQQKLFSELLIEEIWGIGRKISARLHTMGIHTIGDFLTMEPAFIRKEFNTPLLRTQRELQGMDCLPLEKITEPQKVILTSRSFGHNIRDLASLQEAVALFTSRCARRLRSQNSLCERVEVFLATNRFRDEPQYSPIKGTTLTIPTASTATLLAVTKKLLEEIYHNNYKYKKAGVIFSGLLAGDTHQMSLFSDDWYTEKEKTLMTVIDKINKKLGDETIRYAATGIKRPWGMLREKLSPKYTTDWNQLPVAK